MYARGILNTIALPARLVSSIATGFMSVGVDDLGMRGSKNHRGLGPGISCSRGASVCPCASRGMSASATATVKTIRKKVGHSGAAASFKPALLATSGGEIEPFDATTPECNTVRRHVRDIIICGKVPSLHRMSSGGDHCVDDLTQAKLAASANATDW